jgi:hypothetical protein
LGRPTLIETEVKTLQLRFDMETASPITASPAASNGNGNSAPTPVTSRTQAVHQPWLRAQSLNLFRHTDALRPFRPHEFGAGPAAPTEGHVQAVNQVLNRLRRILHRKAHHTHCDILSAMRSPTPARLQHALRHKHQAHVWVQAIEKIWDFYFELFGQRQSIYADWLVSCDRVALDAYQVMFLGLGKVKSVPAPPPFCYMRTGFGPATYRRSIPLQRLGQQLNPFPLIQLPYHRLVNPWTLGAVLHEVSHNLQNDLGLSRSIPRMIALRLLRAGLGARVAALWTRWNREIYADLNALLLGGPAIVASLMDVVGRSPEMVYSFNPRGVHPTPYLRTLLNVVLLRRMGFKEEADKFEQAWRRMFPNPDAGNIPRIILKTAPRAMTLVVDAICYQSYRELGDKSLSQIFSFGQKEQRMAEEAARRLANGTDPGIVPERFMIAAARFAVDNRLARSEVIKNHFFQELARR